MFKDLREFIEEIRQAGELKTVDGANWDLELGAITYTMAKQPNPPAILYDNIKGYPAGFRVLTMPASTNKRAAIALGFPLESSLRDLVNGIRLKVSQPFQPVSPITVKDGPVLENVHGEDKVDVFKLPVPKWHPLDGGRYIGTGDMVILKDPDSGYINIGTYRTQVHSKNKATIFIEPGRHGDIIRRKYWDKGLSCPVAMTTGSHPLDVFIAGDYGIPWGTCEYDYLGWWRNKPIEVVKGPLTGLPIPARAEIALEGEIAPPSAESLKEGPFPEFTGYLSPVRQEGTFRIKSVMHRDNPIILGLLPFIGFGIMYWPSILLKPARLWNELERLVSGVKGVWMPYEFGTRGMAVISIKQQYGGHAKRAAYFALAYLGYMQKTIVVVDDDVDPFNLPQVFAAIGTKIEPDTIDIVRDWHTGGLDPMLSPQKKELGDITSSAAIILACKPYHWMKQFPTPITLDPEMEKTVRGKWGTLFK